MARKDMSVQVRVEARTLATIGKWMDEKGAAVALKSVSALGRTALELLEKLLVRDHGAQQCTSAHEAQEWLDKYALGGGPNKQSWKNIQDEQVQEQLLAQQGRRGTGNVGIDKDTSTANAKEKEPVVFVPSVWSKQERAQRLGALLEARKAALGAHPRDDMAVQKITDAIGALDMEYEQMWQQEAQEQGQVYSQD